MLLALLSACSRFSAAQTASASPSAPFEVVIAPISNESKSVVAIPPITSWQGAINIAKAGSPPPLNGDLSAWVSSQDPLNGLEQMTSPWHILISFEQFDHDGDKIHSGTFEEFWEAPKLFKTIYKSDVLNQTDYATAQGLFRLGDQQWPNRALVQVAREVISPFAYASTLRGVSIQNLTETYGEHQLACAAVQSIPGRALSPTRYCFDAGHLRYAKGFGWYQTTYNDLTSIAGHSVARAVDVYDAGHPYLKLRVRELSQIQETTTDLLIPPAGANLLSGKPVSGVQMIPIHQFPPNWPDSMRNDQFSVTVEILIGKDGRVVTAHAVSGPQAAYKSAEKTAKSWDFVPYLILGEPSEVMAKIQLSNN